jgi:hypothetical protein
MLSGKQIVKGMLSDNLEKAVRETSSQTVASISLENIVREGNQHFYDVREDTSLSTNYIGLGLLHWFGFTTLVWVYYIGLGLQILIWVYYIGLGLLHWFGFTDFDLGLLHWFGFTDIGLGLLHWFGFIALVWAYYICLGLLHWFGFATLIWVYRHWFGFTTLGRVWF